MFDLVVAAPHCKTEPANENTPAEQPMTVHGCKTQTFIKRDYKTIHFYVNWWQIAPWVYSYLHIYKVRFEHWRNSHFYIVQADLRTVTRHFHQSERTNTMHHLFQSASNIWPKSTQYTAVLINQAIILSLIILKCLPWCLSKNVKLYITLTHCVGQNKEILPNYESTTSVFIELN